MVAGRLGSCTAEGLPGDCSGLWPVCTAALSSADERTKPFSYSLSCDCCRHAHEVQPTGVAPYLYRVLAIVSKAKHASLQGQGLLFCATVTCT